MLNLLIYMGTSRQDNYTQYVAKLVHQVANSRDNIKAEIITTRELDLDFEDEGQGASPKGFKEKVAAADGYIIVSPEYNHGYPGSLKYMLDLNLKEYIHKPVAFVGVSSGPFGGIRMIENLVPVTRELGMVASFADVAISNVQDEIVDGKFSEPEKWEKRLNKQLDEIVWLAETLKHGRDNLENKYH